MDSNFISNGVVRRVSHLEGTEGRLEVSIHLVLSSAFKDDGIYCRTLTHMNCSFFPSQNLYKDLIQNWFFRCSLEAFHKLELVRKLEMA
jgi:hypothetical protein